jgi:hypothetical protein
VLVLLAKVVSLAEVGQVDNRLGSKKEERVNDLDLWILLAMNMEDRVEANVVAEVCFRRDLTAKEFWIQLPVGSNPNRLSLSPMNRYSESWV